MAQAYMDATIEVEVAILAYMREHWTCSMEELFRQLPQYTPNQMFLTVDRLSREGKVILRYRYRSEYVILQPDFALQLAGRIPHSAAAAY